MTLDTDREKECRQRVDFLRKNVPKFLQDTPQWVVWRAVVRNTVDKYGNTTTKVTKPPFCPRDCSREASTVIPSTWGTFEEALQCYAANYTVVSGVGFAKTEGDNFYFIDLDSESKVAPEDLVERRATVAALLEHCVTYTEVSPSGDGLHMVAYGNMPVAGRKINRLGVELFGWNGFLTFTGNVLEGRTEVTNQQWFVDAQQFQIREESTDDAPHFREMDLGDEEVLRRAALYGGFAVRYSGEVGAEAGSWSESHTFLVGCLDRITGSVEQIKRIMWSSPFVTQTGPSNSGEERPKKSRRIFNSNLSYVRQANNRLLGAVGEGRRLWAGVEAAKLERAREAARLAREAVEKLSRGSARLLDAFPQLQPRHKTLSRPPGVIGRFVEATERASHKPFTKFAIPATFSSLSGLVARGYKLPRRTGINVNFIVAAPTNTGKTEVMKAWEGFVSQAVRAASGRPLATHIANSSTHSIQGMMFEHFKDKPSCTWFCEECGAQVKMMSQGTQHTESALRDGYNMLYDASVHGKFFTGPVSVSASTRVKAINNLSVSTFWCTVPSKLDILSEDALDGFLSRVVVVRHKDPAGAPEREPVQVLAPELLDRLTRLMQGAQSLNDAYAGGVEAGHLLYTVDTSEVSELLWQLILVSDATSNAAIRGDLPPAYVAVGRLALTALRLAGVMAVVENEFDPRVTEEQLLWATGYVLQNLVELFSAMDLGELGGNTRDDVMCVVRTVRAMMRDRRGGDTSGGLPGVPKSELRNRLRGCKPFSESPLTPAKAVRECLEGMLKDGLLSAVDQPRDPHQRGPSVTLLCPTEDVLWS